MATTESWWAPFDWLVVLPKSFLVKVWGTLTQDAILSKQNTHIAAESSSDEKDTTTTTTESTTKELATAV